MPNIGGPELIVVLLIFVLLFGAKKLPELGSSVCMSIKNFKKGIDEGKEEESSAAKSEPATSEPAKSESSAPGAQDAQ